jgi:hypothetical protein
MFYCRWRQYWRKNKLIGEYLTNLVKDRKYVIILERIRKGKIVEWHADKDRLMKEKEYMIKLIHADEESHATVEET